MLEDNHIGLTVLFLDIDDWKRERKNIVGDIILFFFLFDTTEQRVYPVCLERGNFSKCAEYLPQEKGDDPAAASKSFIRFLQ